MIAGALRRILLVVLVVAAWVSVPSLARAERCGDDARAWLERCATRAAIPMRLEACPSNVAVVELRPAGSKPLRVEISTSKSAFRRAGEYGLAPIGDFSDWKLEAEPTRAALDAIVRCAESEPPRALLAADAPPPEPAPGGGDRATRPSSPPLLLIGAAALVLAACALAGGRTRRAIGPAIAALSALAAIVVLRRLLVPFAFFHQNGQGPEWIAFAVRGDAGEYGPGYPEVFGWIAARARRPDHAVAIAQELLAATVPVSGFAIVRSVRGSRALAVVAAIGLAIEPVLTRAARSESYFATIASLLFAAAALLSTTDRSRGLRARALGITAAALLVAQAARIHPLAWIPCAAVPLVLACRPGALRRRLARTIVATLAIGAIATPLVLPAMRATLRGHLGAGFLPGARAIAAGAASTALVALLAVASLVVLRRTRAVGSRAFVLVAVAALATASNVVRLDSAVVSASYVHLFVPSALAAVAGVAAVAPIRAANAAAAAAIALAAHAIVERPITALPTDARELAWALEWRETLPAGAQVASVARVDPRMLSLPLAGEGLPRWIRIGAEGSAPFDGGGPRFYYRSSLCASAEGAPVCARFESQQRLRLVASRRFPAQGSLPWLPLPPGEVEVALFALE